MTLLLFLIKKFLENTVKVNILNQISVINSVRKEKTCRYMTKIAYNTISNLFIKKGKSFLIPNLFNSQPCQFSVFTFKNCLVIVSEILFLSISALRNSLKVKGHKYVAENFMNTLWLKRRLRNSLWAIFSYEQQYR